MGHAAMRWEAMVGITGALLVASAVCVTARIVLERRRHLTTCSSVLSMLATVLAWCCFATSFTCMVWRGRQITVDEHQPFTGTDWITVLGVDERHLERVMKVVVVEALMIPTAIWFVKFALLAMFYGVADRIPPKSRFFLNFLGPIILGSWLVVLFTYVFVCRPFRRQWSLQPEEFCSPLVEIREQTIYTSLDVLCNILFVIFGFHAFSVSALPRRDRISVAIILIINFTASIASLTRIGFLACTPLLTMEPRTVNVVVFLSRTELALTLIATSWPTLRGIIETALFQFDVGLGCDGQTDFAKSTRPRVCRWTGRRPRRLPSSHHHSSTNNPTSDDQLVIMRRISYELSTMGVLKESGEISPHYEIK